MSVGTAPAYADVADAQALTGAVIHSANAALEEALSHDQVAQAKPVGEVERPLRKPGLPLGLAYTLDGSIAFPFGHVTDGNPNVRLPGGFDAVLGYGFTRQLRLQAGYYVVQEYPVGFSTGKVPLYLQGLSAPIGTAPLAGNDATVRNGIFVANLQTLVQIGKLPIVISPTYVARTGTVGGHSDLIPVEINGFAQLVHLRTFQYKLLGFTIPFLSTPKMFGTYTIAPQWLMQTAGANTKNSPQLFQLMYLEYRANAKTTFFLQPSLLQNYTPVDAYPEHIPTLIYGFSYRLDRLFYLQGQVSTGTPVNPNNGGIGIRAVTCQQLPCSPSQVAPTIGGLKASQVQLMLGFGKPQVVPL
ncbi:MAG TPA: hypothetical protein VME66_10500 [Candidatus Acidoferrales bacterium]|nr:hypothetical protein [Candidatus Acidoferrales bacterium]